MVDSKAFILFSSFWISAPVLRYSVTAIGTPQLTHCTNISLNREPIIFDFSTISKEKEPQLPHFDIAICFSTRSVLKDCVGFAVKVIIWMQMN